MGMETVAQIFGLCGMTMNVLSYQRKEQREIIFMQLIGSLFFAVNFFMIGAFVGALLNVVGMLRAVAYWQRERFHAQKIHWVFGLGIAYIAIYILSFTVFGTEPTAKNLSVEILPVIGMIITTVSFYLGRARAVRILGGMINSPLWLTYNIVNFTLGGIISESVSLVSIVLGIIRYDVKKKEKPNEKAEP